MMKNTILLGDVQEKLKEIPNESVDCCVTSPPYWGLRDYKLPDMFWGTQNGCQHDWKNDIVPNSKSGPHGPNATVGARFIQDEIRRRVPTNSCIKCGAWWGALGLEPTPELYVSHLVEIFREVKRVLKKEGTVWLNLGDSYAGGGRGFEWWTGNEKQSTNRGSAIKAQTVPIGLKPKDLVGIPWRVAFALQADGWWLRSDIIWSKPNPMPESVTDRPTKSHEYIFLLSKSANYYFDQEAVMEPYQTFENRPAGIVRNRLYGYQGKYQTMPPIGGLKQTEGNENPTYSGNQPNWKGGRNIRSVWHIPTQPFTGSKFLADYVGSDGRAYKVSKDCPIHGQRPSIYIEQRDADDEPQDESLSHNQHTSSHHGQELVGESVSILDHDLDQPMPASDHGQTEQNIDVRKTADGERVESQNLPGSKHMKQKPVSNLDFDDQSCVETAISHNKRNRKKALVSSTNSSYISSDKTLFDIDGKSNELVKKGSDAHTSENNTSQDDKGGLPLAQTTYDNASTVSSPKLYCKCEIMSTDHFATFPEKLIEPCIKAGCPEQVCKKCGKARERLIDFERQERKRHGVHISSIRMGKEPVPHKGWKTEHKTVGWSDCGCNSGFESGIVLDPFLGSGTTAVVAKKLGRNWIGIELNSSYVEMAERRISNTMGLLI